METTETKLLQGIDTVIVRTNNYEESKKWYLEKLEFDLLFEDANTKLVVLDTHGPTSITLWQTDQIISLSRETASYPIFKTADAHTLRQTLLGRGVEVEEIIQDDFTTYFFFYDRDGNILEACQVSL